MNTTQEERGSQLKREVQAECVRQGTSLVELAEKLGINYPTLFLALKRGSVRALTMNDIRKALDIDNDTWLRWSRI